MNTLSNVTSDGTSIEVSCNELASNTLPKVKYNGVSVRYAYNPNRQWYVLRITYNRLKKAEEIIDSNKAVIYYPVHRVVKVVHGKRKRINEPLLPNIIFAYTTPWYINSVVDQCKKEGHKCITFYLNHFKKNDKGKNPPLIVDYAEMMNFIRVTSIDSEHVRTVSPEQCHYKSGDYVTVIDGDFVGVRGRVARVSGQQRVIVNLEGLCLVATAYIPTAFIQLEKNI